MECARVNRHSAHDLARTPRGPTVCPQRAAQHCGRRKARHLIDGCLGGTGTDRVTGARGLQDTTAHVHGCVCVCVCVCVYSFGEKLGLKINNGCRTRQVDSKKIQTAINMDFPVAQLHGGDARDTPRPIIW